MFKYVEFMIHLLIIVNKKKNNNNSYNTPYRYVKAL